MSDHRTQTRLALRKAELLPVKPQPGCPDLPAVLIDSEQWANREEFLAAAEAAFKAGHGLAALLALEMCAQCAPADPLPRWLLGALSTASWTWREGITDSLEEGLGASLGGAKHRDATMRARAHGGQMLIDTLREIDAGKPIDAGLWERVGTLYGLSERTAERTVRALARRAGIDLKARKDSA